MLSVRMLFRQLQHQRSASLTYLIASRPGAEALLIDPVLDQLDLYLRLVEALDLRLVFAVDTHTHLDHVSALDALRESQRCMTAVGRESRAAAVARPVSDGEIIAIDGLKLQALHTPGHSADSYCFVMDDRVFTGDTLLIRGTGRTDQGGDARQQYESLFNKLITLPGRTLVYPGHDYNGRHVSTIMDERNHNPRLQVTSVDQYVSIMDSLRIHDATLMDAPEKPSLRPNGSLLSQLATLRSALGYSQIRSA